MLMSIMLALAVIFLVIAFFSMPVFGRTPEGNRLDQVRHTPNYVDGEFRNLKPTQMLAKDASYGKMLLQFFGKGRNRQPSNSLPVVKTDLTSIVDDPVIIWFGHSSYLIRIDGRSMLIDPVFSKRPSPVQFAGTAAAYAGTETYCANDFPSLDAIIITHDHYDHLDYHSIRTLAGRTAVFYTSLGVGQHLERWGIRSDSICEFVWWQSREIFPGIHLTATPARHFSGRLFARNKTLWSSFVLQTSSKKIFIGGDSGYDDSFKKIGSAFGPFDLAILEAGQYDPQWPLIHMAPEETVQAAIDLEASVFLPVHWAKFTLALHPWKDPIERVVKEASLKNVKVVTPMIGQPYLIGTAPEVNPWWTKIS